MAETRLQTAFGGRDVLLVSAFENHTLWEFVGEKKYLQMAVSKAVARAYASKFGAVTTKSLSKSAAYDGYLLLVWAVEVGCDWNEGVFIIAIQGSQIAILQWLFDNECPRPTGLKAYQSAAKANNLQAMEWLRQNGFEWEWICHVCTLMHQGIVRRCLLCETEIKSEVAYTMSSGDEDYDDFV